MSPGLQVTDVPSLDPRFEPCTAHPSLRGETPGRHVETRGEDRLAEEAKLKAESGALPGESPSPLPPLGCNLMEIKGFEPNPSG